jgi:hypothetical protein
LLLHTWLLHTWLLHTWLLHARLLRVVKPLSPLLRLSARPVSLGLLLLLLREALRLGWLLE